VLSRTQRQWRGGRGSNSSPTAPVSNGFEGLSSSDDVDPDGQIQRKTAVPGSVGTLDVPDVLELVRALETAADAIESGRAEQLTAEWRMKLGAACRAGADLARSQLAAAASRDDSGKGEVMKRV
jgi:hypothetical protein